MQDAFGVDCFPRARPSTISFEIDRSEILHSPLSPKKKIKEQQDSIRDKFFSASNFNFRIRIRKGCSIECFGINSWDCESRPYNHRFETKKRRGWCIVPRLSDDLEFHYRILGYTREYYPLVSRTRRLDTPPVFSVSRRRSNGFLIPRDTANYHSASTLSTLSIDAEITSQRRRGEFWNFHSSFVSDVFLFQVCQEYRCVNHRFTTYFSWTTVFASRNHLWTKSARKSDEGFAIDKVISTSEEKVIVEQGISFLKKKKLISLSMNSNNFTQRRCRLEITREKVERKYK